MGVESRLVLIRNVNYVLEQQQLKTRAEYDRKLTNTLSHELLTPLNCIINVSKPTVDEAESKLQKYQEKFGEDLDDPSVKIKLKKLREKSLRLQLIWSSGKILEFTICSMIARQQLT